MHCLAHRRSLHLARIAAPREPRRREILWCVLEVLHAAFDGQRISHKDLTALADGVISAATISRAVDAAEQRGLLAKLPDTADRRVVLLEPTPYAVRRLLAVAPTEYSVLDEAMTRAHGRLLKLALKR